MGGRRDISTGSVRRTSFLNIAFRMGFILMGLWCITVNGFAQSPPPSFRKFQMGKSACYLHFPAQDLEVMSDTLDSEILYVASAKLDKHLFRAELTRFFQPVFSHEPQYHPDQPDEAPMVFPNPVDSMALAWMERLAEKHHMISNGDRINAPHPSLSDTNGWQESWTSSDGKAQALVQVWANPGGLVFLMISGKTLFEDEIVKGIFFRNIVLPRLYRE